MNFLYRLILFAYPPFLDNSSSLRRFSVNNSKRSSSKILQTLIDFHIRTLGGR